MPTRHLVSLLLLALAGCGASDPEATTPPPSSGSGRPPDHIVVDHILIGVKSAAFPDGKRSPAEAKAFAYALYAKLKGGADWATAKRESSEDPPPGGPYAMCNRGVRPTAPDEISRVNMVPAFGDVGFSLEIGGMGMADYDARKSPFGYHIIKRVK
jgi:hypothetical protein